MTWLNDAEIKTAEEKAAEAQKAAIDEAANTVQSMLDTEARSREYGDIDSIAKYLGYDNIYRAECESLAKWCAACWVKFFELQAGGEMPADLLAEMPPLEL